MRRRLPLVLVLGVGVLASGCGGGGGAGMEEGDGEAAGAGDAGRGKEVFLTSGCGACHTFAPAGSTRNVGPNLDQAVQKYDADFIRESILDPSAYIEKGQSGSIGGAEPYRVTMPAYGPDEKGQQKLSEQQIADLVAFLGSAKK